MASSTSVFLFENTECVTPNNVFSLECVPARPLSYLSLLAASMASGVAPLAGAVGAALGVWGAALVLDRVGEVWRKRRDLGDLRYKLAERVAQRAPEGDRFAYIFPDLVRRAWRIHKGLPEYPEEADGGDGAADGAADPPETSFACYYSEHGNLFMRYNSADHRFHFWSSKSIPRHVLEAAARKYVQSVGRPDLYRIPQYVIEHVTEHFPDPQPELEWAPEPKSEESGDSGKTAPKKSKRVSLNEARRGMEAKSGGSGGRGGGGAPQKYAATYLDGAKETFDSNIFLHRGTLREFDILQKKPYGENKKKGMSFSDFMKWKG
jgi:hypothetical protein